MSKASQREAKQKKEESEQEKLSKFSTTLRGYLNTFAELYRQEISDEAIAAYVLTLRHLSPRELEIACTEVMKKAQFFPRPAEILAALEERVGPVHHYRQEDIVPVTPEGRAESKRIFDSYMAEVKEKSESMPGQRWSSDDGWLPREESWRREEMRTASKGVAPRFHVVDKRITPSVEREPGED